eukprot:TRINITY_DN4814_c3_g1_i1.p1 TRINITY_DN4814_c3_g1~~TRINITY_DN4814_c3_g1_i1.p1  ORF type:complete len:363 (+),score=109.95 TRINITY_DN4814_c3_g1_i1:78-1166(+)
MPAKGQSAKDRKKAQRAAELAMKESMEACTEGEAILDKINVDKGLGVNQFPKAVVHFTKAIEGNPGNAAAYLLRAKCMKLTGEFEKAIADYSKAAEINPTDPDALSGRSYCHSQIQEWDATIADCTAVIAIQPEDGNAFNLRGYARASKRAPGLKLRAIEYKQILEDYTQAVSLNDCNYHAYANRGNVRFDRGEYFNAIEDYSRALFIKDDYWYIHYRRGVAYYEYVFEGMKPKEDESDEEEKKPSSKAAPLDEKKLKEMWEEEFWKEEYTARQAEQQEAFLNQALQDLTTYMKHVEKEKGEPDTSTLVHRAHVYLLQRNFDDALKDFKKAKELDKSLEPLVNPQIDAIREQTGVKALVHAE